MSAPAQVDPNFILEIIGPSPTPLEKAICDNDVSAVLRAIASGEDPSKPNLADHNALHIACLLGRAEIAKELIAHDSALLNSAHKQTESRPLHFALQTPDTDVVVAVLLEGGADPCLPDDQGTTCLHLATFFGNTKAVKLLVDSRRGAELLDIINEVHGVTALVIAASEGNYEIMRILLEGGASPNICRPGELTVLERLTKENKTDLVQLALEKGADPNKRSKIGTIPIHDAAYEGHTKTLEVLLNASPSTLNAKTNTGATPLILSAQKGHVDTVKFLIAKGADVNLRDAFGATPWDIAMGSRDPRGEECAKLIEEAGGKGDDQPRGPLMLFRATESYTVAQNASGEISIEGEVSDKPFDILLK